MKWLTRLHGRRTPPGLEIVILKRLPLMTLVGTLCVLALPVLVRVWPEQADVDHAKHIRSVDIFAIATEITLVTAVLTIAIGCVIVHIMKGPAYVADSLKVEHSDRPRPRDPDSDT